MVLCVLVIGLHKHHIHCTVGGISIKLIGIVHPGVSHRSLRHQLRLHGIPGTMYHEFFNKRPQAALGEIIPPSQGSWHQETLSRPRHCGGPAATPTATPAAPPCRPYPKPIRLPNCSKRLIILRWPPWSSAVAEVLEPSLSPDKIRFLAQALRP